MRYAGRDEIAHKVSIHAPREGERLGMPSS
jgi:hypothetical protein